MEHEDGGDTYWGWCTWDTPQRISKGTGRLENKKRGQVVTLQIQHYMLSAKILRSVKDTCRYSNSSKKPIVNAGVKKLSNQ